MNDDPLSVSKHVENAGDMDCNDMGNVEERRNKLWVRQTKQPCLALINTSHAQISRAGSMHDHGQQPTAIIEFGVSQTSVDCSSKLFIADIVPTSSNLHNNAIHKDIYTKDDFPGIDDNSQTKIKCVLINPVNLPQTLTTFTEISKSISSPENQALDLAINTVEPHQISHSGKQSNNEFAQDLDSTLIQSEISTVLEKLHKQESSPVNSNLGEKINVNRSPASLTDNSYNPFETPTKANWSMNYIQRTTNMAKKMFTTSQNIAHSASTPVLEGNGNQSGLVKMVPRKPTTINGSENKPDKFHSRSQRMSLGGALMMPPPPRVLSNMDWKTTAKYTIGAVGILYGDVAACPMYVFKSIYRNGVNVNDPSTDILGSLSMMVWTTILLGVVKYCLVILHADSNGEGGMLALLSLIPQPSDDECPPSVARHYRKVFYLALTGCCFLLADGFVTPAICILAALEGFQVLETPTPTLYIDTWRVPVTCLLMVPLFYMQRFGLTRLTSVFPLILVLWFITIAYIGILNISQFPAVLLCFNPIYIVQAIQLHGFEKMMSLMATVLLVVSGLEFLYADLGAFKRKPIILSFCLVVLPCTLLNYLGQGAFLLNSYKDLDATSSSKQVLSNLFFESSPQWAVWPLVIAGTFVSLIGSQSAISACFALIDQAISIKAIPPIQSIHILGHGGHGTYYVPLLCFILFVGGVGLSVSYQHSESLSEIVGFCVSGAMFISSMLVLIVMKTKWQTKLWKIGLYTCFVFGLDCIYLIAAFTKVLKTTWVTLIFSSLIFLIMYIFIDSWQDIHKVTETQLWTMQQVRLHVRQCVRVKGCGVFIACDDEEVPRVFTQIVTHLSVVPEDVIFVSVQCIKQTPFVASEDRVSVRNIGHGVYRVLILFGFAERCAGVLESLNKVYMKRQTELDRSTLTFYVSKYCVYSNSNPLLPLWKQWQYTLFDVILRNAGNNVANLQLPMDQVIEISDLIVL